MDELAPEETFNDTSLPDVRIHKSSHGLQRVPLCYRQGIIIVGNRAKEIHLGGQIYHDNPDNYLVITVPMLAECETIATPEDPLLAMMIDIDLTVLHEIITEMETANRSVDTCPKGPGLFVSRSTHEIHDARRSPTLSTTKP